MNEINDKIVFAAFGCWNTGCDETSEQKKVIEKLAISHSQFNYKFLVILGDNYYAKKIEIAKGLKFRDTNLLELQNGFRCLNILNIEKKLILGNHDILDSYSQSCSVPQLQMKIPWIDVKFPFGSEIKFIKNDKGEYRAILFIYIDSTLYDKHMNDDSCYIKLTGKSFRELIEMQNKYIIDTIQSTCKIYPVKNIIFFAHQPLFELKTKISSVKATILDELLDLLFKLIFDSFDIYNLIDFTWICADYHIYQHGEIDFNGKKITQLIFGTGGGELDDLASTQHINLPFVKSKYSFNIFTNELGIKNFGFGHIEVNFDDLNHNFIALENKLKGGNYNYKYKYKYEKYKLKYNKLKLN